MYSDSEDFLETLEEKWAGQVIIQPVLKVQAESRLHLPDLNVLIYLQSTLCNVLILFVSFLWYILGEAFSLCICLKVY